ncbi:Proline-rich receptor-like protein kinase PERK1, partial [Bienertia sinuspersici]
MHNILGVEHYQVPTPSTPPAAPPRPPKPHSPQTPPPPPGQFMSSGGGSVGMTTNGFSESNLLGQDGFGYVHKGVLPNGKEVAVKSLKAGSGQGEREFQAEVEIISRVHHKPLVSLVGYCITRSQNKLWSSIFMVSLLFFSFLVYFCNGQPTMEWPTRMRIAVGAAKGLAYLHED